MKKYLSLIVYMLIGAICGILSVEFIDLDIFMEHPIQVMIIALIGLYGGYMIQIAIHELGHLIFGLMSGYSFNSYRIFNLMWIKNEKGVEFKRYSLAGTGGQCLMNPPELVDGKIPYILYNLGGILLNGIASILIFGLGMLISNPFISTLCKIIAFIGVVVVLTNGLPIKIGGVATDGYNALSLGKDKDAIKAFYQQMKIAQFLSQNVPLKDMPDSLFEVSEDADTSNVLISSILVFKASRLMNEHKFDKAYEFMKELLKLESLLGIHKNVLINDCIFCEIISSNDQVMIDSYCTKEFKQMQKAMKKEPSFIRTQYILTKDPKYLDLFEKVSKTHPYACEIETEREIIEYAKNIV